VTTTRSRFRSTADLALHRPRAPGTSDDAGLDRLEHGAPAVADPELAENARYLVLDRALGGREHVGDLAVGRRDLVDLLLAAGAELNSRADDGRTTVTEALRGKHPELADYLRSKGARGAEITADLTAPSKD
jgi:hypothetical protein